MFSYSVILFGFATGVLSASTCTEGLQTINGRQCTIRCNVDRPGGDYAALYAGSWDGCITACAADSHCVTAQYHISNGYCYMKNSRNMAVSDDNDNTIDCENAPSTTTTTTTFTTSTTTTSTSTTTTTTTTTTSAASNPYSLPNFRPCLTNNDCENTDTLDADLRKCICASFGTVRGFCYSRSAPTGSRTCTQNSDCDSGYMCFTDTQTCIAPGAGGCAYYAA